MNHSAETCLRAGVARADITTDDPAAVIHDPLFAKALVLDDGTTRAAILAMDVTAIGGIGDISDGFLPALRDRIERELAIPAQHVLVNASHTHPPGRLLCEENQLLERTVAAVRRAAESMEPVTFGVGTARENRFVINRTLRTTDGLHWTIRHANPCPPDELVEGLGPLDDTVGILRFDRAGGGTLAVVYNFACHPLQGLPGHPITANYPGFASRVIEENLGGATALFLQGAGGDVTEVLYKDVDHPRDARPLGRMLGLTALEGLRRIEQAGPATLAVASRTVRLPRRTDIPERIGELEDEQSELLASLRFTSLNFKSFVPLYLRHALNPEYPADYAYRYLHEQSIGSGDLAAMDAENRANLDKYLANIRAMERLARIQDKIETLRRHKQINDESGETTIEAEVMGLRIGECLLITAPVEMLTEVGLNVKRASPVEHTFVASFTNGYMHYGAPASYYDKGGYEVTECLLAPQWQAVYEKAAGEVIAELT